MEAQRDRHQLQAMAWNEGSRASGEENSMGVLQRNFYCSMANNACKIVREISYLVERKETCDDVLSTLQLPQIENWYWNYCRLGKIILGQQKSPNLKFKSQFASGEVNEQIRFFVEFGFLTFALKNVSTYIYFFEFEQFCIKENFVEFTFMLRRRVFEK